MTSLLMSSPPINHIDFFDADSHICIRIASSPSFSRTASRKPRRACSQDTFDPVKSHFSRCIFNGIWRLVEEGRRRDNHYCLEPIFVKLPIFKRPRPHELDIFKSAYFVTRIRVDRALNYSGERLKKMWFQWADSLVKCRWKVSSRKKIYAVSKKSAFVWTWPKTSRLYFTCTPPKMHLIIPGDFFSFLLAESLPRDLQITAYK